MRAASTKPAPRLRALPDVPRRALIIAVGLTGSVLLAATIIWGISRMGPRTAPLIEADGRPFRVRPENMPPAQPAAPLANARSQPRPDQAARLAPAPEAPRTDALRQQMEAAAAPPAAPPAATPPSPAPATSVASAPRPAAAPAARTAAASPAAPAVAPVVAPRVATPAPAAAAAAAAAARPAPATPAAVSPGRAEVQFAALASEDAAKQEWERLKRRIPALAAMQPRISRFAREGQPPLWRLRVSTADAAAAHGLCEQARAKNASCVPV